MAYRETPPHLRNPEIRKWTERELWARRVLVGSVVVNMALLPFERVPRPARLAGLAVMIPAFAAQVYAADRLEALVDRFYLSDS